jgi:hypothetical protein
MKDRVKMNFKGYGRRWSSQPQTDLRKLVSLGETGY